MSPARRIDWSAGPGHGPVSGVANAAGAALGLTMVADLVDTYATHVSPVWSLTAGVVAAGAAAVSAILRDMPDRVACYRGACWAGAGLWSAWTLSTAWWLGGPGSPWTVSSVAALGIGGLGAAMVGLGLARSDKHRPTATPLPDPPVPVLAATAEPPMQDQVAEKWQRLLRKITKRQVTIVGVEMWNPPTGYTLDVDLPADGTTIDDIKQHEKALATAGDVPPGCAVEVVEADLARRQILIRIGTADAMAEDHHLPDKVEADTVENDLSIGIRSDRTEATIRLRESCAVLVGQTGSGKSNQLNVITARLAACTDVLIWAIDLSGGGRYPRPWVRAWREGRAPAPVIDWVAPTVEEARLMTLAALNVINGRTAAYEQLMFAENADKIMPRPTLPQIILVVDEFGELPDDVKDSIRSISDTGRGAAVRTVSCALEATASYLPRPLIAQARERIIMRVSDEEQLQYLLDRTWRSGRFDPKSLIHRGTGVWTSDGSLAERMKGWRMEPAQIDAHSIAAALLRPELDDVSVRLADVVDTTVRNADMIRVPRQYRDVYTGRWARTLPHIFPDSSTPAAPPAAPEPEESTGVDMDLGAASASLAAKLAAAQRAAEQAEAKHTPEPPADMERLNAMLATVEPRQRMRQLVHDAGEQGTGPGEVHRTLRAEGHPTSYQTVVTWMRADAAADLLVQPSGDKTPYYPGPRLGDPYS